MKLFLQTIILLFITCSSYAGNLEILYVTANVGAAAGGHVGLRLDDDVFHYQFYPDDRFLLVRESWDSFQLVYNRLRNRTIYGVGCPVPDRAFTRIKDHFSAVLASQKRDFFRHRFLLEQKELLAGLRSGSLDIAVRGLGAFDAGQEESGSGQILRTRISAALGENYLQKRREALAARIKRALAELYEGGSGGKKLVAKIEEISDLEKQQAAYGAILDATGLLDTALAAGIGAQLSLEESNYLEYSLDRRLQVLVRLLVSERSDSGEAILVETARCLALIESLTAETLVTLDPYPDEAVEKQLDHQEPELLSYLNVLFDLLNRQRSRLLGGESAGGDAADDYRYLQLENVNGRLVEIGRAIREGRGIRVSPDMMVPGRTRTFQLAVPVLESDAADSAQAWIERELASLERSLDEKYRYALIRHNCVTELLKNLNSSFSAQAEAEESLGGWIDPANDRVAVPHDFFYHVSTRYRIEQHSRYPSRRIMQVEAMEAQNSPAAVWFREGNTVSTTLYKRREEDTPFLFFTDDVIWARPILGLANLLWSASHGLAGIVTLPAEGTEPVYQAVRGMFYSLPELVFFNIRKGTYLHDAVHEGEHEL